MNRLEEIQDELAILNGYNQLYEISYMPLLETLINESIKKYTLECVKASLEKASETSQMNFHDGHLKTNTLTSYFMTGADSLKVSEESITNPENIILL